MYTYASSVSVPTSGTATHEITRTAGASGDDIEITVSLPVGSDDETYDIIDDDEKNAVAFTLAPLPAATPDLPVISIAEGTVDGTTVTFPVTSDAPVAANLAVTANISSTETALVTTSPFAESVTINMNEDSGDLSYTIPNAVYPAGTITATLTGDGSEYTISNSAGSADAEATTRGDTFSFGDDALAIVTPSGVKHLRAIINQAESGAAGVDGPTVKITHYGTIKDCATTTVGNARTCDKEIVIDNSVDTVNLDLELNTKRYRARGAPRQGRTGGEHGLPPQRNPPRNILAFGQRRRPPGVQGDGGPRGQRRHRQHRG